MYNVMHFIYFFKYNVQCHVLLAFWKMVHGIGGNYKYGGIQFQTLGIGPGKEPRIHEHILKSPLQGIQRLDV